MFKTYGMIEVHVAAFELIDPGITGKNRLEIPPQVNIVKSPVEWIVNMKYTQASVDVLIADAVTEVIEDGNAFARRKDKAVRIHHDKQFAANIQPKSFGNASFGKTSFVFNLRNSGPPVG